MVFVNQRRLRLCSSHSARRQSFHSPLLLLDPPLIHIPLPHLLLPLPPRIPPLHLPCFVHLSENCMLEFHTPGEVSLLFQPMKNCLI